MWAFLAQGRTSVRTARRFQQSGIEFLLQGRTEKAIYFGNDWLSFHPMITYRIVTNLLFLSIIFQHIHLLKYDSECKRQWAMITQNFKVQGWSRKFLLTFSAWLIASAYETWLACKTANNLGEQNLTPALAVSSWRTNWTQNLTVPFDLRTDYYSVKISDLTTKPRVKKLSILSLLLWNHIIAVSGSP